MSNQFEWKDDYNTGIQRIDNQHKYFLNLINWLLNTLISSKDVKLQKRCVDEVIKYAKFHFYSEENLMIYIGYPEFQSHEELHTELINKLNYRITLLDFGKESLTDFVQFLREWFLDHTFKEDKKIGLYADSNDMIDKNSSLY